MIFAGDFGSPDRFGVSSLPSGASTGIGFYLLVISAILIIIRAGFSFSNSELLSQKNVTQPNYQQPEVINPSYQQPEVSKSNYQQLEVEKATYKKPVVEKPIYKQTNKSLSTK